MNQKWNIQCRVYLGQHTQKQNLQAYPESCAGKFLITLLYSLQEKVILGMVIAFPEKLEGISQQEEMKRIRKGGKEDRKKGRKELEKKKMKFRAPGMLKTTRFHRSSHNDQKKKKILIGFVFLLFLMEHSCSKLISRDKTFFQPCILYVKHGFSQWL